MFAAWSVQTERPRPGRERLRSDSARLMHRHERVSVRVHPQACESDTDHSLYVSKVSSKETAYFRQHARQGERFERKEFVEPGVNHS